MYSEPKGVTVLGWDGHLLLLHRSEGERCSALAAWVTRGLEGDEKVIFTEAATTSATPPLLDVLARHGVDVGAALAEGRLSMLSVEEFYPAEGQFVVVERALSEGYRRVRLTAAAGSVFTHVPAGHELVMDGLCHSYDELCSSYPVSALCQYGSPGHGSLTGITAAHPDGVRSALLQAGPVPDGGALIVVGEIDTSNDELFTCTVRAAADRSRDVLRLDLSGVTFLAAGGCRALVVGTRDFRARGGRLILRSPAPMVEHVLRVVGLDRLPNVELARNS